MTVDELIAKLKPLNGKLTVVVYDGTDPSDLVEVSHVEVEKLRFFSAGALNCEKHLVVSLV